MSNVDPLDFSGQKKAGKKPPSKRVRVAERQPVGADHLKARMARMPGMNHLTSPEAIYSGRLSGPWTLVRRQLLAHGDDSAKAWAEKVTPVVTDLRTRRRDPQAVDWDGLRKRQEALLTDIKSKQDWMDIEGVAAQVDRIEDLMIGFDEAKKADSEPKSRTVAPPLAPAPPAAPEGE